MVSRAISSVSQGSAMHHRCAKAQHDMKNPPSRGHPNHTAATPAFVFGFVLACKAFPNVPLSHPRKNVPTKTGGWERSQVGKTLSLGDLRGKNLGMLLRKKSLEAPKLGCEHCSNEEKSHNEVVPFKIWRSLD